VIAGAVSIFLFRDKAPGGSEKKAQVSVKSLGQGSTLVPPSKENQIKKNTPPQEITQDLISEEEFKKRSYSSEVQIEVEQTPQGYSIYLKPEADLPDPANSPLFSNDEWDAYEGHLFRSLNGEQSVVLTSTDQQMLAQWKVRE
jgi:hypothetical protein